ncbi:uncharacterized protein LOC126839942 [Adelges cooleyi]|uniref:uncharacterized protein LOC126839942 n=1 Tax=Adelges cooleyi TaxID=133065 RepID=UPI00217FD5EC|nr:uncharacterized protein LOC126839942 [Adelges cooleyi]
MYSKNVILFFCAALYFLQCQGGSNEGQLGITLPTDDQLDIIQEEFEKYSNPDGIVEGKYKTINLIGIRDIIEKVVQRLDSNKDIPTVDALKTILLNITFTEEEVKALLNPFMYGKAYVEGRSNVAGVLFALQGKPNGILFKDLQKIIDGIQKNKIVPGAEFPYHKELKTALSYNMSKSDYQFGQIVVEYIITEYLFPGCTDSFINQK